MPTDQEVTAHYLHGRLEQALLAAVSAAGKDPDKLIAGDLMAADEFHIGGPQATKDLISQLDLGPTMHILDIGSGLGGPARHLASAHGCRVTGIDLSGEFVSVATSLTRRMGLDQRVGFRQGSAAALPFPEATFDGATMFHVGMNIADKQDLCQGVRRVLRPGGFFAIYDIMRTSPGALDFPVPWASSAQTSFVEPIEAYRSAFTEAGFTVTAERDRADFARNALIARQGQSDLPPLSRPIVMGPSAPQKIANLAAAVERGLVASTEIIGSLPRA